MLDIRYKVSKVRHFHTGNGVSSGQKLRAIGYEILNSNPFFPLWLLASNLLVLGPWPLAFWLFGSLAFDTFQTLRVSRYQCSVAMIGCAVLKILLPHSRDTDDDGETVFCARLGDDGDDRIQ